MKFEFKKAAAILCAAAAAMSLCGCADKGSLMTVDGMTIRNGVYLYYQQTAYSEAQNALSKQNESTEDKSTADSSGESSASDAGSSEVSAAEGTGNSASSEAEEPDLLDQTIEGKTAVQWIKDDTMKLVRTFVTVQRLCEEKGISLTDEESNSVNSDVNNMWDQENFYVQYLYGYPTMGEYYESMGIAKESIKQIYKVDTLKTKLFTKFYDKDGETPVSDDEISAFLKDNYIAVKTLNLGFTDSEGNALTEDADKQAVIDRANEYADRLNGGESIIDIKYDIDLKAEQEKQKPSIEEYYNENDIKDMSLEEYTNQELAKLTVDKISSADELDTVCSKTSSSFGSDMTDYIDKLPVDGKAVVYNDGDQAVYIIVKENPEEKSSWLESNRTGVLMAMKSDDFDSVLELYGQNYDVDADSYLVDSKYSPEKLRQEKSESSK